MKLYIVVCSLLICIALYGCEDFIQPLSFKLAIAQLQTAQRETIDNVDWEMIQTFEDYLYTDIDAVVTTYFKQLKLSGSPIRQRAQVMIAFRKQLKRKRMSRKYVTTIEKELVAKKYSLVALKEVDERMLRTFYGLHSKVVYCRLIGKSVPLRLNKNCSS